MKPWSKSNKLLLGIVSAAAVVTAAALLLRTDYQPASSTAVVWTIPNVTRADLDQAGATADSWTTPPSSAVHAGILPHHALVSPIMAGWFAGLADQPAPKTVVIIGPDHVNRGAGYFTTAAVDWQTPDGRLSVNGSLVKVITENDLVVIDETLIQYEHGVYTALPYIRRAWPAAKVVTIAVKGDARPDRINQLAQILDEHLEESDLVIATVDFSHYTTAVDALRADEESLEVIRRGDMIAALSIPVDSPPAISLVLAYAHRRSLTYQQLFHTTSAQFVGQLDIQSTTSYLSAYFVSPK